MQDSWLIAIAMSIAGAGITMLLFALIFFDAPQTTIDIVKSEQDNFPASLSGSVQAIRTIGNKTLITISQPSTIDIIIENAALNTSNLNKNSCITITGKKSSYNNKAQIIASKVQQCRNS